MRQRAYLAARRLIASHVPDIVTSHPDYDHVMSTRITGFRPNGYTFFDDVRDLDVR